MFRNDSCYTNNMEIVPVLEVSAILINTLEIYNILVYEINFIGDSRFHFLTKEHYSIQA